MSWFRVDDVFYSHPKVQRIPRSQRAAVLGTWLLAGTWCANLRTDGVIPAYMVEEIGGSIEHADVLVKVGLLRKRGGTKKPEYVFHDWAEYQPLVVAEDQRKAKDAKRKREERAAAKALELAAASERTSTDVQPDGDGTEPGRPPASEPRAHAGARASRPVPSRGLDQDSDPSLTEEDREPGTDDEGAEKLAGLARLLSADLGKVRRELNRKASRIVTDDQLHRVVSIVMRRTGQRAVDDWTGFLIGCIRNDWPEFQKLIDGEGAA